MKKKFSLSKEKQEDMIRAIKTYFNREREEEIGDLAAKLLLDFFTEELAPVFYNQAVEDCHTFMAEKLDDLFEIQK